MKKYETLYAKIKREIVTGALSFGAKLPSKRTLAAENGVSAITAETALDLLKSEGYIDSKERSGYFVAYDPAAIFFSDGDTQDKNVPNFAFFEKSRRIPRPLHTSTPSSRIAEIDDTNENSDYSSKNSDSPPPFPFSCYAKAVRAVLNDYGETLLQKPTAESLLQTKRALKNYLSRSRGIEVEEKQIVLGSGAEYLYGRLADLFGKDKIYGVESPSYGQIEKVYEQKGFVVRRLPLGSNGVRSDALENTDANVFHLTPYRSYPTLTTADASKKAEYLRCAKKKNAYVVEDDYLSEFCPSVKPTETLFSSDREGRVVYVNTFSKTISPSLRIAYMLLPPHLADEYEKNFGFYACSVPLLEQYVLASLLNDGTFERHVNKVRRLLRRESAPLPPQK